MRATRHAPAGTSAETPVIKRRVARVLLFDPAGRLLLLFDPDPVDGGYWYPPGGRMEEGESPEEAARRELVEELGIDEVEIGPVILKRRARFAYGGRSLDQDEVHLLSRVESPVVRGSRAGDIEAAAVAGHRWWLPAEIRASGELFFPEGLAEIVERVRGR
jgi:8-oxo-dGTP pyrophosphatase MutT (NUDIX family)